jgi:hypothetical protein
MERTGTTIYSDGISGPGELRDGLLERRKPRPEAESTRIQDFKHGGAILICDVR